MRRPSLSVTSFLGHLFHPKKNALPTGIRKRKIQSTKGRKSTRVSAYNKMPGFNQEILERAGAREEYLKGTLSLADAKRKLREQAVTLGIAKPVRQRTPQPSKPAMRTRRDRLEAMIALHIGNTVLAENKPVSWKTLEDENEYLIDPREEMMQWDYGRIKYAGRKGSEYEVISDDGKTHNPFWYH